MPRKTFGSLQRDHLGRIASQTLLAAVPLLTSLCMLHVGRPSPLALRALVLIMFVCALVLLIRCVRAGGGRASLASTALLLGFCFWYAYPALITFFVPDYTIDNSVYSYVDDESIVKAIALLSLYLFSAVLVLAVDRRQVGRDSPAPKTAFLASLAMGRLIPLAVVACLLGLLPLLILGGNFKNVIEGIVESRAVEKAWLQNENLGDRTSSFTFVASSVLIAGVSLLWVAVLDRRLPPVLRTLMCLFAFLVSIVVYFDQGTRTNLVLFLLPALVLLLRRIWKRSRVAATMLILMCVAAGVPILQFQTLYRSSVTRDYMSELLLQNWHTLGGTLDFFSETVYAVSIVPSYHGFFRESLLASFLVSPIPRFLWPGKPFSELIRFYVLMRWGIDILTDTGNTFPGLVGQYYMSWGWFGPIIIGALFGLLASRLDTFLARMMDQEAGYLVAPGIMAVGWMLLSYRVLSPSFLYPVAFCALIVWTSRRTMRSQPRLPIRIAELDRRT